MCTIAYGLEQKYYEWSYAYGIELSPSHCTPLSLSVHPLGLIQYVGKGLY